MGATQSYTAPLKVYDGQIGALGQGWSNWGWQHSPENYAFQGLPALPPQAVAQNINYVMKTEFNIPNQYGGLSFAKPGAVGATSGKITFWMAVSTYTLSLPTSHPLTSRRKTNQGRKEWTLSVERSDLGDASPKCGAVDITTACTPSNITTDAYSYCEMDISHCQAQFGPTSYNRFKLQANTNSSHTLYITDITFTEWPYPAPIMQYMHLVVTWLSFVLSLAGTLFSISYIIYLHVLARKTGDNGGAGSSAANRRNMMLHFMAAMMALMLSDILSIIFNARTDGVSTPDIGLNRIGQAAILLELIAFSIHLFNRIKMQRAFEPITWYPRPLQYILIFISFALPIGVGVYLMYLVMQATPEWPKSREYALLVAVVWCIALDNCLTIASLFLLFRIRTNLAANSTAQSNSNYAVRKTRTVVVTLVVTLILALFLSSFCITHWTDYPYVFQITFRIYFWAFLHYLLTLRRIMSAYREIDGKTRSNLSSARSYGQRGGGGVMSIDVTNKAYSRHGSQNGGGSPTGLSGLGNPKFRMLNERSPTTSGFSSRRESGYVSQSDWEGDRSIDKGAQQWDRSYEELTTMKSSYQPSSQGGGGRRPSQPAVGSLPQYREWETGYEEEREQRDGRERSASRASSRGRSPSRQRSQQQYGGDGYDQEALNSYPIPIAMPAQSSSSAQSRGSNRSGDGRPQIYTTSPQYAYPPQRHPSQRSHSHSNPTSPLSPPPSYPPQSPYAPRPGQSVVSQGGSSHLSVDFEVDRPLVGGYAQQQGYDPRYDGRYEERGRERGRERSRERRI
ncbi:hypothetical protein HDV00_004989 [Rhizophlyctis rosea]|nr:hypothetical protein HDV00_004989 [Rhizophlyctis rosea]